MADVRARIQQQIEAAPVVLFMKGDRRSPQCGFSATVVSILDDLLDSYETCNVLADPELRQGIKDFSDWPTIPQLYVRGEFVGGCDIVKEMFENGELEQALGLDPSAVTAPSITVTAPARDALLAAVDGGDEYVHLEIDGQYNHGLSIAPRKSSDLEVKSGELVVLLDRGSARRAEGVVIDYVDSPSGQAFKITNPNEPKGVQSLSVGELATLLEQGAPKLYDVRTPEERAVAKLEAARLLDRAAQDEIFMLPKDTPLYFMCHHGVRSRQAAEFFNKQGYSEVFNVEGGIDAWSRDVDPDVPRYD